MDGICAIGLREPATYCCACQFPLVMFCEGHLIEHRTKPGFHFTLPLEARVTISTEELFIQYRDRLTHLSFNFDLLRNRVDEFSKKEKEIDDIYGALQQHVYDTATNLKYQFSVAKAQFSEAVENAIKETSDHILDTQWFVPGNYFSQLLCDCSTSAIAALQFYSFQANYFEESLDSAFQVTLRFNVPGLEHLKIGQLQGDCQKLIAVLTDQVQCFDVATNRWQQFFALHRYINVDEATASTFIAPNTIIVCGGGEKPCTCHVGKSAYMLVGDGSVQELTHMSTGRNCPGIAWDSDRQALYVFGGSVPNGCICYPASMRTSEILLRSEWSPLPNMNQPRCAFNPCWHSFLLYLCGGAYTTTVETYDPRSNIFAPQNFQLPENGRTTAVVECGTITVISPGYISTLQQGRLTSQQHEKYLPWSNCTPLVSEGVIYIVSLGERGCRGVNLESGAKVTEVGFGQC